MSSTSGVVDLPEAFDTREELVDANPHADPRTRVCDSRGRGRVVAAPWSVERCMRVSVASSRERAVPDELRQRRCQRYGAGPDLVLIPPLISNVELGWEQEVYRRAREHVGRYVHVLEFDKRGIGSSDCFTRHPTFLRRGAISCSEGISHSRTAASARSRASQARGAFTSSPPRYADPPSTQRNSRFNAARRCRCSSGDPTDFPSREAVGGGEKVLCRRKNPMSLISKGDTVVFYPYRRNGEDHESRPRIRPLSRVPDYAE